MIYSLLSNCQLVTKATHLVNEIFLLVLLCCLIGCSNTNSSIRTGALPTKDSLVLFKPCNDSNPPQRWSVSIGIDQYQDQGIPALKGASHDAWLMHHYFSSAQGANVDISRRMLLLNHQATVANIKFALGKFLENACPQDTVFVYYAGHGAPEPGRDTDAFLFTHDTDLDNLVGTAISMQSLPDFFIRRVGQAGRRIMMIDACHSGNINFPKHRGFGLSETEGGRGLGSKQRSSAVYQQLRQLGMSKSKSLSILTAASDSQLAAETETESRCPFAKSGYRGGLFTCAMIDQLRAEQGKGHSSEEMTISTLYPQLEQKVGQLSAGTQTPQWLGADAELPKLTGPLTIPRIPEELLRPPSRDISWVTWGLVGSAVAAGVTSIALASVASSTADQAQSEVLGNTVYEEHQATRARYQDERKHALWATWATAGLAGAAAASLIMDLTHTGNSKVETWFTVQLAPLSAEEK